ncbi:MAG TPA: hypothetical protein VNM87_05975, partial [Candidatus Udaeobacter sp.]|nr:hypothetical protein [Candidatus Udaeobacter sp.]
HDGDDALAGAHEQGERDDQGQTAVTRPPALDTRPIASRATVKPRKTKPWLQPVSWLIGPARTPRH